MGTQVPELHGESPYMCTNGILTADTYIALAVCLRLLVTSY